MYYHNKLRILIAVIEQKYFQELLKQNNSHIFNKFNYLNTLYLTSFHNLSEIARLQIKTYSSFKHTKEIKPIINNWSQIYLKILLSIV